MVLEAYMLILDTNDTHIALEWCECANVLNSEVLN